MPYSFPPCFAAENVYDRVCVYESSWYKHLDTWTDDNLQCICIHGNSQCETMTDCPGCTDKSSIGMQKKRYDKYNEYIKLL